MLAVGCGYTGSSMVKDFANSLSLTEIVISDIKRERVQEITSTIKK